MTNRGLGVPPERAEAARRRLKESGWLRTDLAVLHEGRTIVFPLTADARPDPREGTVVEREFAALKLPVQTYRELIRGLPAELAEKLPRSFDVVGDIVLVRIPEELLAYRDEVGRALLAFVPGARLVGWDQGVHGVERRRRLVPLAGTGEFRTRCRENGLTLDVDLDRAYYSPRLSSEHARVAQEVRAGERVFDLCCGIGPFALSIARDGRAREVVAVDLNREAISLLRANADRLGLSDRVRPVVSDVGEFLESAGVADRAILNLPHEGIKYLASVANRVGPAGTLHYYEMMERSVQPERPQEIVRGLEPHGGWELGPVRGLHPYSPTSDLISVTFHRRAEAR